MSALRALRISWDPAAAGWRGACPGLAQVLLVAALAAGCMPGKRDNEPWVPANPADAKGDSASPQDAAGMVDTAVDTAGDALSDGTGPDSALDSGPDSAPDSAPDADLEAGDSSPDTPGDSAVVGVPGCTADSDCAGLPFGPCASGRCDLATGLCQAQPAAEGSPCGGGACSTQATCKSGACSGTPVSCDDGNSCTGDSCHPEKGCENKPLVQALCDDGQKCTPLDLCDGGKCAGAPLACDDGDPCTDDSCNSASGQCNHLGFASSAKQVPCSVSGGGCWGPGLCQAGVCKAESLCDDGNPCTFDLCSSGSCSHLPRSGACTPPGSKAGDLCAQGLCLSGDGSAWQPGGAPPVCVPQPACAAKDCLAAKCDPVSGQCSYPTKLSDDTPCSADSLCTTPGKCLQGQCKTAPLQCNDSNPCTQESCDPAVGCKAKAKADGGPCDDGNGCTQADSCSGGKCAGKALSCDDANPCSADSCDPISGCSHAPEADGAGCPGGTCKAGQCAK